MNKVNFEVHTGEFVAITGESGKTTLLNCLGSLDKVTSGKIIISGMDITNQNDSQLTDEGK